MKQTQFRADSMLGKLAKWLRLMGYSVSYVSSDVSDDDIIRQCRMDGSFLLTRDKLLHNRYKDSMYLNSDNFHDQLKQFISTFKPDESNYFTRCPICNSILVSQPSSNFRGMLPENILMMHDEIFVCSGCGKLYWKGTHYFSIKETIRSISGNRV